MCARVYGYVDRCASGAGIAAEISKGTGIDAAKLPPQGPYVSTQWVGDEPFKPVKTKAAKPSTA